MPFDPNNPEQQQYGPAVPADWSPVPETTQDALDQLGASSGGGAGVFVAKAGDTMSGDLTMLDNIKVLFGDAGDAGIYFNGTNLVIDPKLVGSGMLSLTGGLDVSGTLRALSGLTLVDGRALLFGSGADYRVFWSVVQLEHTLISAMGTASKSIIFTDYANQNKDHDHAAQANPTIFVHSVNNPDVDNTEWISISHDGAKAVINSGKGGLNIGSALSAPNLSGTNTGDYAAVLGGMYIYENAVEKIIDTVNKDHAVVTGMTASILRGVTYSAGERQAVTAVVTAGGGSQITLTSAGHGLSPGDYITLTGFAGSPTYNDVVVVDSISGNDFTVTIAFDANDTGFYARGSSLTVSEDGIYEFVWATTVKASANNKILCYYMYANATRHLPSHMCTKYATGGDIGAVGGSGFMSLSANDVVWFTVANETDSTNLTFHDASITVKKVAVL